MRLPVNYFELHIGDYAEATGHLSILEDGVYGRLMRKYYATEKPLPRDVKECQRLVGCRTPADRQAVERILGEFFECRDDGWHQHTCDEVIERYLEAEPEREAKRENEKERKRRYRENRARIFKELRELGVTPKWDTPMGELEANLSRLRSRTGDGPGTDRGRGTGNGTGAPGTPPGTRTVHAGDAPGTASQSPIPTPQSPIPNTQDLRLQNSQSNLTPTLPVPSSVRADPDQGSVCGTFKKVESGTLTGMREKRHAGK